jgi:predicted CopG family antitoxin
METTIQISRELLKKLAEMKMHEKESYESIVWDLIEDRLEFSEQTKHNITTSEKEIKTGKIISLDAIKKKMR